jgi:hypothetical protein
LVNKSQELVAPLADLWVMGGKHGQTMKLTSKHPRRLLFFAGGKPTKESICEKNGKWPFAPDKT